MDLSTKSAFEIYLLLIMALNSIDTELTSNIRRKLIVQTALVRISLSWIWWWTETYLTQVWIPSLRYFATIHLWATGYNAAPLLAIPEFELDTLFQRRHQSSWTYSLLTMTRVSSAILIYLILIVSWLTTVLLISRLLVTLSRLAWVQGAVLENQLHAWNCSYFLPLSCSSALSRRLQVAQ